MARKRRTSPDLRRLTAYVLPEEYDYILACAEQNESSVSAVLGTLIQAARARDKVDLMEDATEALWLEGAMKG